MRLSHQIEQFLASERHTTVRNIARHFGISLDRCREEIDAIAPFGIRRTGDDHVLIPEEC